MHVNTITMSARQTKAVSAAIEQLRAENIRLRLENAHLRHVVDWDGSREDRLIREGKAFSIVEFLPVPSSDIRRWPPVVAVLGIGKVSHA